MKPVRYLFLMSLLLSLATRVGLAQSAYWKTDFERGAKQIALSYGYGQGYWLRNRSVTKLQAGYYPADRLLIGLVGTLSREWLGEFHTDSQLSIGPFVRYQFTSSRLSPFAELAYQFGRPTPAYKQAALFTPGINFSLFPHVRLEASYCFLFLPFNERSGQPQAGAIILFGSKRQ